VITRAARRAGDRIAGKSSTTNRLLTFRMLAYGPTGRQAGFGQGALGGFEGASRRLRPGQIPQLNHG
jgi:hypothetical protein